MITGKWADIGKFKGPILRALASRAPYFHNGLAASLEEVVDFYESRFSLGLTAQDKADSCGVSARTVIRLARRARTRLQPAGRRIYG